MIDESEKISAKWKKIPGISKVNWMARVIIKKKCTVPSVQFKVQFN